MKKKILAAALFLSLSAPAFATTPTSSINPNLPAQGSLLSSSTLRGQFVSAISDINNLWTALYNAIAVEITSLTGDVTTSGYGAAVATVVRVNGVTYPTAPSSNSVPVVTGTNAVTYEAVPNAALANSSMNLAGHTVALGGVQTFAASDLTNGTSGSGTIALTNSPVFTTPNIGTATGNITGNAATATALQNAQTINGVSFNGTAGITVTAAAGTLTGSSLASGVTSSSLTSLGTLTAPLNIGTPGFSDTGVGLQFTGNTNGYAQIICQNTNSGSSASCDFVFGGNDMTASTHYGDLGSNGAAGGSAPFTNADARYLYTTDNELDIAALGTSGAINFATGATPTTQMTVGTSGVTLTTALASASGGTGATSLGVTLTNSGGVLNTTNPADYAVTGGSTTNIASCSSFSGRVINISGGSGATTLTLPSASSAGCTQGVTMEIDNNTSSTATWSASGSTCGLVSNLTSSCTVPANTGCTYRSDGTNWPANNAMANCFPITVGSLPAATTAKTIRVSIPLPSTGVQGAPFIFPCPGTITGWSITSNAANSSMVVDVWKAASGAVPTISNTITASALPTLSSAQIVRSTTLTGWTTSIAAGDVLLTNVNSFSTGTNFIFTLNYTVSSGACNAD